MPPGPGTARWVYYTDPLRLIIWAISSHLKVLWSALLTFQFSNFNLARIRSEAFAKWYEYISPNLFIWQDTTDLPRLISSCYGTVLDVGSGDGTQMSRFNFSSSTSTPPMKLVYGLEPNAVLHGISCDRVANTGLDGKFLPILGWIEDEELLQGNGITKGSVDCILCVQVLCSVRDPKATVKQLYKLLKPGGMLVFWEHRESRNGVTRGVQSLYNLVWPLLIGGCRLDGRQDEWLLTAGEWEVLELKEDDSPHALLPQIWGRLVKKGGK